MIPPVVPMILTAYRRCLFQILREKNSDEQELMPKRSSHVRRKHGPIQCSPELPCVALLLDLNVDPKLRITFPKELKHSKIDQCLRIYVAPHLHSYKVAELLRGLVLRQEEAPSQITFKHLHGLVNLGALLCYATRGGRHKIRNHNEVRNQTRGKNSALRGPTICGYHSLIERGSVLVIQETQSRNPDSNASGASPRSFRRGSPVTVTSLGSD
ncbi:uncharacterized protein F5147DRAFT_230010 [Suillus discolor]|uniref:Uncharacterized protein n=1 Tax=Suillus discolor TaxID=1912936 RepID=A0A9P7F661_9AGAM|nr:uncharacterized protein F5147DRAFT_230010 [Suillus discolor]KAG2106646.1 hypothetical protein F5147DRAFT_230010 [Suillus discolor]